MLTARNRKSQNGQFHKPKSQTNQPNKPHQTCYVVVISINMTTQCWCLTRAKALTIGLLFWLPHGTDVLHTPYSLHE